MAIKTRIKEVREREGYSRKQFAELFHVPYSSLTNYENGTRKPPQWLLFSIADEFDTTIDYLMCYTENPSRNVNTGNEGIYGKSQMRRGIDILLWNLGYMCETTEERCCIFPVPGGVSAEITNDEFEQFFSSVVDFTRFTVASLYEKALQREKEKPTTKDND